MTDNHGRKIEYLRLSLTERCRQRCIYCSEGGDGCSNADEMSAADFIYIAKICSQLGFKKIRLTGGEPLLRHDICGIVSGISKLDAYEDIALTTNAAMLSQKAKDLRAAGLMRCNISLDSLNPETYKIITGCDLQPTLEGIRAAKRLFSPLKINTVLIKGVNDSEIADFIRLAEQHAVDVRFIELMPMGGKGERVKNSDIIAAFPHLVPCRSNSSEPAVYYKGEGFKGRVGFISPITDGFCGGCNRIRITSGGVLRPCLGSNLEFSLRKAIDERDDELLARKITEAIRSKPLKNSFGHGFTPNRKMNEIGG